MARRNIVDPDEVPSDVIQADSGEARADTAAPVPGSPADEPEGTGPRYRVVGPHAVLGVAPGGLIRPSGVTPGVFRVLLGSGHIAPADSEPESGQETKE